MGRGLGWLPPRDQEGATVSQPPSLEPPNSTCLGLTFQETTKSWLSSQMRIPYREAARSWTWSKERESKPVVLDPTERRPVPSVQPPDSPQALLLLPASEPKGVPSSSGVRTQSCWLGWPWLMGKGWGWQGWQTETESLGSAWIPSQKLQGTAYSWRACLAGSASAPLYPLVPVIPTEVSRSVSADCK